MSTQRCTKCEKTRDGGRLPACGRPDCPGTPAPEVVEARFQTKPTAGWERQPMETAPKDGTVILAWCDHEADPYVLDEEKGTLTLYAAHAENAPTGWHLVQWGGGWADGYEDGGAEMPDWWFVAGSEFEKAANPVYWYPLPKREES